MPVEQPAYLRVADELRKLIVEGTLAPGEKLPSQAQIRRDYGVSDTVALEARRLLITEGLAEGRSGSGTYVRQRPAHRRLLRAPYGGRGLGSPFLREQDAAGRSGTWESDSETSTAPTAVAKRLGIAVGDPVMRTRYLFSADGAPVMTSTSWEPLAVTGGTPVLLPEEGPLAGAGVVDRMAAIDVTVDRTTEELSARPALEAEARLLGGVAGTIVMAIARTYFANGLAVETADIVVPADRYAVAYEMTLD